MASIDAQAAHKQAASDAELARAARAGDSGSLGALFERYRPRLYALALRLVGYRAAAEDAVHDTFLVAIGRLGRLRDPAAVGGWLHAILRNRCLMELRRRRPQDDALDAGLDELPDDAACVERCIESRELREWVWSALGRLSEAQRVAVLLRYFGSYHSYEDVAAILGVPVGTVRSRLSDAKCKLADLLLRSAARDDSADLQGERREFFTTILGELYRGRRDAFLGHYADDLQFLYGTQSLERGRIHLDRVIDENLRVGVRVDVSRVLASGNLTVVEGVFVNPAEHPQHCPPGVALVLFHSAAERVGRVHVHHAPRPPMSDGA